MKLNRNQCSALLVLLILLLIGSIGYGIYTAITLTSPIGFDKPKTTEATTITTLGPTTSIPTNSQTPTSVTPKPEQTTDPPNNHTPSTTQDPITTDVTNNQSTTITSHPEITTSNPESTVSTNTTVSVTTSGPSNNDSTTNLPNNQSTTTGSTITDSTTIASTTTDSTTIGSTTTGSTTTNSTTTESATIGSTTTDLTITNSTTTESTTTGSTTTDSTTIESTTIESTNTGSTTTDSITINSTTAGSTTNSDQSSSQSTVENQITTVDSSTNEASVTSTTAVPNFNQTSKLILANTDDGLLLLLDLKTKTHKVLVDKPEQNITAFDYFTNVNIYYGTGDLDGKIYSLSNRSVDLDQYRGKLSKAGLAIDFISEKVYVVDSASEQLVIMDMNGQHVAIVLSDLENPKDILLDPIRRLMFILQDNSILQANMDGTEVKKIVKNTKLKAVTLDSDVGVLYFATTCALRSVDYVNDKKIILINMLDDDVLSLTMIKNELFYVGLTKRTNHKILKSCTIVDGCCKDNKTNVIDSEISSSLKSIKAYIMTKDVMLQNPCEVLNEKCQHLCVLTPNENDCRCECSLGWQLSNDLEKCEPVDEYLLFAQNNVLRRRMLNFAKTSFIDVYPPYKLNDESIKSNQSIDFDYIFEDNLLIHATDSSLTYTNLVNLTKSTIEGSTDCDIIPVVDWISKNLYYARNCANDNKSYLMVRKINDESNFEDEKFLLNFGGNVQSLVIHPNIGKIFFPHVKSDGTYQLHMIDLDGKNFANIVNLTIYKTGLAIDYIDNRIYFLSEDAKQIKYRYLDTYQEGITVVDVTDIINPMSISVYKEYIYVSNSSAIWRFHKETGKEVKRLAPILSDYARTIHKVKVFSKSLQPIANNNSCDVDNGACERYCFAVPSITRKLQVSCDCNDNEVLHNDNRTCIKTS